MTKIIIVYTSMTGNTESMAEAIAAGIKESGFDVEIVSDPYGFDPTYLTGFQGVLIGTYTYGAGELPYEIEDFYEDLERVDLTGKMAAVFGSFDSAYGDNGIAVDMMRDQLKEQGAEIVHEGYKIELTPTDEQLKECKQFGVWFSKHVTSSTFKKQ